jgi:carbamoyltransferase
MALVAGFSGPTRNGCVALCHQDRMLGICEQERITRVRAAGFNATGLPDEALDELLHRSGRRRPDIWTYAFAESADPPTGITSTRLGHHLAHASAAFFPSPFRSAAIIVCDHEPPQVSVWYGDGTEISQIEWPWEGRGFAELVTESARALGFDAAGCEQRMEALARLEPGHSERSADQMFELQDDRLVAVSGWQGLIEQAGGRGGPHAALAAAAVQSRLGDLLVDFLGRVKRRLPDAECLCVGGSLFYNSYLTTRVKLCCEFEKVFVPINPGNAGLAVGAALYAAPTRRQAVTPFLGPSYGSEEIKGVLDNCKLTYRWGSEAETIALAVDVLRRGKLVAWFDGAMEWGPRALGARSILASPFNPYVLDNLNRFLKHRDSWRGYALSVRDSSARMCLDGPDCSPFMECDYTTVDRERFRHVLPGPRAAIRVQTVGSEAPGRLRTLLDTFAETTGLPAALVNTSFNSFLEPIVCSPRDAVRVFYGTGIDMMVLGQFVVTK